MKKFRKVSSISDFFTDFVQLEEYLLRGQRGTDKLSFLFFLVSNVIFIHAITYLWFIFADKPLVLYREYFSYTFSLWNAFSAVIMCKFGKNNIRSIIRGAVVGFVVLFSQLIILLAYLNFIVESSISNFDFLLGSIFSYFKVLPFLLAISILQSSGIILKNLVRIVLRLAFFITPIIWIPEGDLSIDGKESILIYNPFFYGTRDILPILGLEFKLIVSPNCFVLGSVLLALLILIRYLSFRIPCWWEKRVSKEI